MTDGCDDGQYADDGATNQHADRGATNQYADDGSENANDDSESKTLLSGNDIEFGQPGLIANG